MISPIKETRQVGFKKCSEGLTSSRCFVAATEAELGSSPDCL